MGIFVRVLRIGGFGYIDVLEEGGVKYRSQRQNKVRRFLRWELKVQGDNLSIGGLGK